MFDGAGAVVQVVAVRQHVHHLPVPEQRDVVPRLGLPGEEEEGALPMASRNAGSPVFGGLQVSLGRRKGAEGSTGPEPPSAPPSRPGEL